MSNRKETSGTDPEVAEKVKRRRFDAAYKLRVLEEADRCTEPGLLGELLRREGLYSSHLATWRRQRELGSLDALGPKKRGRKANSSKPSIILNGLSDSREWHPCGRKRSTNMSARG